ncbi:Ig-like domain-containing protein, partial [Metapseudomonas otitidis]|uniref:Ig-like domain-containing protein n=1 Tax=Metapseudomonas otitidis TaxID=319939 RepID=UPI001F1110C0
MNFACITDKDALYFFPLNEQEGALQPIQAIEGARYVFTEQEGVDISQAVATERVNDDLYLLLRPESESSSSIQIKDFFQLQGSVYSLSETGEYRLHLSADSATPAGPVALGSEYLGMQQDQPEATHLKVMQQAVTFQTLDQLAELLNPSTVPAVEPLSASLTPSAEPVPSAQEAEPKLLMAAMSETGAPFAAIPSITGLYDQVGSKQGELVSGSVTDDKQPRLTGLAEPNTTLDILLNGVVIDTATVDGQGNWSYTPKVPLGEGGQLFFVRDQSTGKTSGNVVLIIDTVAPARAMLSDVSANTSGADLTIAKNGLTNDNTPTLTGKAEANSLVIIYNDKTPIASIYADQNGNWSWTALFLPDGTYALKVAAMDHSGNVGLASSKYTITIDTTPPDAPTIDKVVDDAGAKTGDLAPGEITDDTTPTLKGKGEPGDTVIILDNGEELGRVVVGPEGTWEFTPETELADGEHSISVIMEDPAGNQSKESPPWVINVDATAPDAPTIGSIYDDAGVKTGDLATGDVTDDRTPTLSGTSEAGSTVVILDNGVEIGRVIAGTDGAWTFTPETELAEGEHSFTVQAIDAAGNLSGSSDAFELVIDTTAPLDPGIDPDGPGISEILDNQGDIQGPIEDGGLTDDTTPTLKGKGEPGDTVIILDNGEELGRVVVGPEGTWEFTPETELADGEHSISVIMEDPAGNQSKESPPWVINVDATAPDAPTIGSIYDDAGVKTGDLATGDVTDDRTPTLSGTSEAGSTVVILDNGVEIGRVIAGTDGAWTFTPETELAEGEHSFTVQAIDAAGNLSGSSDAFELVI